MKTCLLCEVLASELPEGEVACKECNDFVLSLGKKKLEELLP